MTLLISDANVLIDMVDGGILEKMFQLPDKFAVPDVLFAEELNQHHPELLDLGLECKSLNGEGVLEAFQIKQECTARDAPSTNDIFALMLAKQEQCPLVTGDKRLRKLTEDKYAEEVELRGTLWIVEQMVVNQVISIEEAEAAYQNMKDGRSRLPWREISRQISRLKKAARKLKL